MIRIFLRHINHKWEDPTILIKAFYLLHGYQAMSKCCHCHCICEVLFLPFIDCSSCKEEVWKARTSCNPSPNPWLSHPAKYSGHCSKSLSSSTNNSQVFKFSAHFPLATPGRYSLRNTEPSNRQMLQLLK